LALAIVITAIVVERLIVIGRAAAVNGRKLTDDLVKSAGRGDLNGARHMVMGSNTPLARVAQEMLQTGNADDEALQSAADDAATLALKRAPAARIADEPATGTHGAR